MKLINDFSLLPNPSAVTQRPLTLTIGNFDGIHLGHQKVLKRVVEVAKISGSSPAVLSFKNHPAKVLRPQIKLCKLFSQSHKIKLLEFLNLELVAFMNFTTEVAELTPREFLIRLHQALPFSSLILGYDASFGKNKSGTKEVILPLTRELNVHVEYLDPYYDHEEIISSSLVRTNLQTGNFGRVKQLLGREYSILGNVTTGLGQGKKIGYPTANLDITGLCLPPSGVYAVEVKLEKNVLQGIANLGVAPTLRCSTSPVLEVHFFDQDTDLYGHTIEVFFKGFIRPELCFENVELLQKQIAKDILLAKEILR